MKSNLHAFRAALLLAALLPFSARLAADPTPTPETALHEIGATPGAPSTVAAPAAPTPVAAPAAPAAIQSVVVVRQGDSNDDNRVSVGDATTVGPNELVPGNAVSILGPLTVQGTVDNNAVTVIGSSRIDGTVHGNAVVVIGSLSLGPHAHVDGNVVAVIGGVSKDPGAYVGGNIVRQGGGIDISDDSEASSWWRHGVRMGRPLAFGRHLHVLWLFNLCMLALYVFIGLAFPQAARKCGDTLCKRPGLTFLTGVLATIALPVVFVLLCVTIVGIPVALIVLPLALLACTVFGKASIYAMIGRSMLGKEQHPALWVLVGALVIMALYLIPVVGFILFFFVSFLGFAAALTSLLTPTPKPVVAAVVPPAVPAIPVVPIPPQPFVAPEASAELPPVPPAAVPLLAPEPSVSMPVPPLPPLQPPIPGAFAQGPEALLPRAGFWIRMVALAIDSILIGVLTQMSHFVLPMLAIYGAILWKLKGSTIGDIIFGIKVVRMDSRPMDWPTAVVRALACFISLFAVGLGFIWIAYDTEKQGWHDRIAGTVVVRLPKGSSLV